MPELDLLILGAHPHPVIGVGDGKIATWQEASAKRVVRAEGLTVLPGLVDAHVHFNDPGRADWEGWCTGSRAALAGGITTVCDMPLNSTPPVVTAEAFQAKQAAAEAASECDFALWGGLVPGHLDDLEPLAAGGAIGFKAFMSGSGIDEFTKSDLATLKEGMKRAARLGLPVGVHAELDERNRPHRRGEIGSVRAYLDSRPIESECAAITAALDMAGETGCALHVVHVSSGRGLALITEGRTRGIDVTAETCPHYLVFTGDDMERLGAVAKCAPPMRDEANRLALLERLRAGEIQTVGSDHSPSPWSMKTQPDFFQVWGGISGVQHLLPVLLDAGLSPDVIRAVAAEHPARRFRLPGKGSLALGVDADLTFVDEPASLTVTAESLHYRHAHSPYVGKTLRGAVRHTILRGHIQVFDGILSPDATRGRLLTPL